MGLNDEVGRVIFSQPDQYGVAPRLDVIHNYWTAFLEQRGRTTRETGKTVTAYVSENRWVADCPECGGGIACWELNPYGCCLTCGAIYKVTYPKDHEAAAEILEARPPANRHWFPHRGETLQHLEAENVV